MTTRDFCFWLQGFFEITGADINANLSGRQTEIIKAHLALVFKHDVAPEQIKDTGVRDAIASTAGIGIDHLRGVKTYC